MNHTINSKTLCPMRLCVKLNNLLRRKVLVKIIKLKNTTNGTVGNRNLRNDNRRNQRSD